MFTEGEGKKKKRKASGGVSVSISASVRSFGRHTAIKIDFHSLVARRGKQTGCFGAQKCCFLSEVVDVSGPSGPLRLVLLDTVGPF